MSPHKSERKDLTIWRETHRQKPLAHKTTNPSVCHLSSKPRDSEREGKPHSNTCSWNRAWKNVFFPFLHVTFSHHIPLGTSSSLKRRYLQTLAYPFTELHLSVSPVLLGYHGTCPHISFFTLFPDNWNTLLRASRSPPLTSIRTDLQTFLSECVCGGVTYGKMM